MNAEIRIQMKKLLFSTFFLVISWTVVSQSCLPEGIIFETQAQIDSFQEDYPGCTEIGGFLDISDSDITDLNGLAVITSIGGSLVLEFNDSLTNLNGLEGVVSVGEDLVIVGNPLLTDLSGLSSLSSIGGYLKISGNHSLNGLSGLDNIEPGTIEDLIIMDNALLSFCDVESICQFLASPGGAIRIMDNAGGCNSLLEVADACDVTISCLPYGDYLFFTQEDIDGFQSNYPDCAELQGDVVISGNDITNLDGLNVVTAVGGSLTVSYCSALTDLAGLANINTVGHYLIIDSNDELFNLTGLENLDSIGFSLMIILNTSMESLTGIDNVKYIGDGIVIAGNTVLRKCEVESICDYLSDPNGTVTIMDNAPGCNSDGEVVEACMNGNSDNIPLSKRISIYPNPASDRFTIEMAGQDQFDITLLHRDGRELAHWKCRKPLSTLDMSNFPSGIYFLKLSNDDEIRLFKIVLY